MLTEITRSTGKRRVCVGVYERERERERGGGERITEIKEEERRKNMSELTKSMSTPNIQLTAANCVQRT